MDLNRLRVFVAVAESASFTAAAERLGLPKSTVSREIARLEEDSGVQLLHRTTRRVGLSTSGAALYERVAPLLAALQQAAAMPERDDAPSGLLRITATADLGAAVLAEQVARFAARHPAVHVEVVITNRVVDLVAEGVDVALRVSMAPQLRDSALTARRLGPLALELYASPGYLARRGAPRDASELAEHDLVGFLGARLAGRADARITADDMFFVRECLRAGAGIGVLPTFLAEADLGTGALARVLPEWESESGTVWLVYPGGASAPAKVTAFRDFLVDALRRRPLAPR